MSAEFDHVEPHAKSGASDAVNIRLLCRINSDNPAKSSEFPISLV